jgi:hypothetical protein
MIYPSKATQSGYPQWVLQKGTYCIRCTDGTHSAAHREKREESAMRGSIMRVTLALGMLMTALLLAPQHTRAEEAAQFDLEKAIMEAKTPAQYETIASYYDQAAATVHPKAAESRKLAATYRDLTGRSTFQIGDHYRQLEQYYERLAVDDTAHAKVCRQLAQAVAQQPREENLLIGGR